MNWSIVFLLALCSVDRVEPVRDDAERLATQLRKLRLIDLVENVDICEEPYSVQNGVANKLYRVKLRLYPPERYPVYLDLGLKECEIVVREQFAPRLLKEMNRAFGAAGRARKEAVQVSTVPQSEKEGAGSGDTAGLEDEDGHGKNKKQKEAQEDEDEDDDEASDEEGADAEKRRGQGTDERGYDDEADEDEKAIADEALRTDEADDEGDEETEGEKKGDAASDSDNEIEKDSAEVMRGPVGAPSKKGKEASQVNDSLSVQGSTFEIKYTVNKQFPAIMLAEVCCMYFHLLLLSTLLDTSNLTSCLICISS